MRVQRKQVTKPTGERVRYSITELTPAQYETILRALNRASWDEHGEDREATELLETLTSVSPAGSLE